jgi:hypothetical protein
MMGFTDTFTRLQHEQPPIIDTMEVQPGVDLEFQGKSKRGPKSDAMKDQMSRAEYRNLVEGEYGSGSGYGGQGDDTASATQDETGLPHIGEEKDSFSAPTELPPLRGTSGGAPQVPSARRPRQESNNEFSASLPAGDSSWGVPAEIVKENIRKIPQAPPFALRNKRETVGHLGRNPRLHLGPLGQTHGYMYRSPQPPLGATMGHGLMRSGSLKEGYFWPDHEPNQTRMVNHRNALNRSTLGQSKSETTLGSSFGSRPLSTLYEPLPALGTIHADKKTAAYRNVRTLMGCGDEFDAYKSQEDELH